MADRPDNTRESAEAHRPGAAMNASEMEAWFVREVLPLEAILMQYLRHHWHDKTEIDDLRQEVYVRVYEFAQREIPVPAKPFILATARNLIIDRIRREHIVPIDIVADMEIFGLKDDAPGPDSNIVARDELRRLQTALERLPPRCREAVVLNKFEGLSGREIASRMGVSEATVSEHIDKGVCALADILYGEPPQMGRRK